MPEADDHDTQILYKSDVWGVASATVMRLFPDQPASHAYKGSYRVVQVAQLRALAQTQGSAAMVWVGVSHTSKNAKTCPPGERGTNPCKNCVQSCLDNMFSVMTEGHSGPGAMWALGRDFNLSHGLMQDALREYRAPKSWDRTVMALGDKDNLVDGLWMISSNPVANVPTDGRRGFDAQHKIIVSEVSVGQGFVEQALAPSQGFPETRQQVASPKVAELAKREAEKIARASEAQRARQASEERKRLEERGAEGKVAGRGGGEGEEEKEEEKRRRICRGRTRRREGCTRRR